MAIEIRKTLSMDIVPIMAFIKSTGYFRQCELEVAQEVLSDAVLAPEKGYESITALQAGKQVGWVCFGATPCTIGTYDVYWIVVDPDVQAGGIGSMLLKIVEGMISHQGGRMIVIETSGSEKYQRTCRFYIARGYDLVADIDDFYDEGDARKVFVKKIKDCK